MADPVILRCLAHDQAWRESWPNLHYQNDPRRLWSYLDQWWPEPPTENDRQRVQNTVSIYDPGMFNGRETMYLWLLLSHSFLQLVHILRPDREERPITCTQLVRHSVGSMLVTSLSSRSMIADVPRWYRTRSRNCSWDFRNSRTCTRVSWNTRITSWFCLPVANEKRQAQTTMSMKCYNSPQEN